MASHKYWNHEKKKTTKRVTCYCFYIRWEKRNRCQVSFPAILRLMLHLHFFHFPLCNLYGNCEWWATHITIGVLLSSWTLLFLLLFICLIQRVILLWNIVSVVYWTRLKGTMSKKPWKPWHSDRSYKYTHRNQWINFSHIFNLEV